MAAYRRVVRPVAAPNLFISGCVETLAICIECQFLIRLLNFARVLSLPGFVGRVKVRVGYLEDECQVHCKTLEIQFKERLSKLMFIS